MKSLLEVNQLKEQWLKDPIWDIENTEGFEEYKDELREYRESIEAASFKTYLEWKSKQRIKTVMTPLYIGRPLDGLVVDGDDDISRLMDEGWTVQDVTITAHDEDNGITTIHNVIRYVTLVRYKTGARES